MQLKAHHLAGMPADLLADAPENEQEEARQAAAGGGAQEDAGAAEAAQAETDAATEAQAGNEQEQADTAAAEAAAADAAQAEADALAAQAEPSEDTWKGKFKTLDAKYKKESARARLDQQVAGQRIAQMETENTRLKAELEALKAAGKGAAPTRAVASEPALEDSDEFKELAEEYGEKAARAMVNVSKREAEKVRAELAPMQKAVAKTEGQAFMQQVYGRLPALVDYDVQGSAKLAELQGWLGQGGLASFQQAMVAGDVDGAVTLLEPFLRSRGATGATKPTARTPGSTPSAHLADRVLPRGAAGTAPQKETASPKRYSHGEWTRLYDAHINDFSDKGKAVIAELDKAEKDGRVERPNG